MVRFTVQDIGRPPSRFGAFGVDAPRHAPDDFASVVRVMHLLPWLDELDVRFGDGPTIQLLEVLEGSLIVPPQEVPITNSKEGSSWRGRWGR